MKEKPPRPETWNAHSTPSPLNGGLRKSSSLLLQLLLFWREDVAGRLASRSPVQGKCFPIDLCVSDSNGGIYPVAEHLIKI